MEENKELFVISETQLTRKKPLPEKRNVVLSVVLSIVTCGFFSFYWMAKLSNDLAYYLDEEQSGWKEVVLSIITCGFYVFYWNYVKGKKMADAQEQAGVRVSDYALIYLIISFFGLMAIPTWVMQADLNAIVDKSK